MKTNYLKMYAEFYGITWNHSEFEVHHIDGNRENNDIFNLVLLPVDIHRRLHKSHGFDLNRYETQILQLGMTDQDDKMLQEQLEVLEACRKWGVLKNFAYTRKDGVRIYEITRESSVW